MNTANVLLRELLVNFAQHRRGVNTYPACIQGVVSVVEHLHFFVHTVVRFWASARYEERAVDCYVPMSRQKLQ